jgi:hypothetical protein
MTVADLDQLQNDAADEALTLLERYRKEVLAAIVSTRAPLSAYLRQLLAEVDQLIARFQSELSATMRRQIGLAADNGDQAVLEDAQAAGVDVPLSYTGVSEQLVRTATEYVSELVTNLATDARGRITREVRLAAMGGMPLQQLVDRIGRNLTSPSVFGTIATRAEMIARTEVSRVRNMAYAAQGQELAQRYPQMKKRWVHSIGSPGFSKHQRSHSRPNHVALSDITADEPIAMDAAFDLGNGITAMYPHDPALPASETVNCRCRLLLVPPPPERKAS